MDTEKTPGFGQYLLRGALAGLLLVIGLGILAAVIRFPHDPPLGALETAVVSLAVVVFGGGAWALLLGLSFKRRVAGAHALAASGAAVLLALAPGDPVAWVIALAGWGVVAGVVLWGYFLFVRKSAVRRSVEEERGR